VTLAFVLSDDAWRFEILHVQRRWPGFRGVYCFNRNSACLHVRCWTQASVVHISREQCAASSNSAIVEMSGQEVHRYRHAQAARSPAWLVTHRLRTLMLPASYRCQAAAVRCYHICCSTGLSSRGSTNDPQQHEHHLRMQLGRQFSNAVVRLQLAGESRQVADRLYKCLSRCTCQKVYACKEQASG
jgi:hypothetical protein